MNAVQNLRDRQIRGRGGACGISGWSCVSGAPSSSRTSAPPTGSRSPSPNVEPMSASTPRPAVARPAIALRNSPLRCVSATLNASPLAFPGARASARSGACPATRSPAAATMIPSPRWWATVRGCGPVASTSTGIPRERRVAARTRLRFASNTPPSRTLWSSSAWPRRVAVTAPPPAQTPMIVSTFKTAWMAVARRAASPTSPIAAKSAAAPANNSMVQHESIPFPIENRRVAPVRARGAGE